MENETQTEAPAEAPAPTAKAKSINDFSGRKIFSATQHEDAMKYLGEIAACSDYKQEQIVSNLGEAGFTEGHVIVVNPYNERNVNAKGDKEQTTVGFLVMEMPKVEDFMSTIPGVSFVLENFFGRVAQTWVGITRKAIAANEPYELPKDAASFIAVTQRSRSGPDMAAYNKYWKIFADWFKARGVIVKKDTLQLYLSNAAEATRGAAMAEEKGVFVTIINQMISKCEADLIDPAILRHWLENRDKLEAEVINVDFGLDGLSSL